MTENIQGVFSLLKEVRWLKCCAHDIHFGFPCALFLSVTNWFGHKKKRKKLLMAILEAGMEKYNRVLFV